MSRESIEVSKSIVSLYNQVKTAPWELDAVAQCNSDLSSWSAQDVSNVLDVLWQLKLHSGVSSPGSWGPLPSLDEIHKTIASEHDGRGLYNSLASAGWRYLIPCAAIFMKDKEYVPEFRRFLAQNKVAVPPPPAPAQPPPPPLPPLSILGQPTFKATAGEVLIVDPEFVEMIRRPLVEEQGQMKQRLDDLARVVKEQQEILVKVFEVCTTLQQRINSTRT